VSSNCSTPAAHSLTLPASCTQIASAFAPFGNDVRHLLILSSPKASPCEFSASVTPSVYTTIAQPLDTVTRRSDILPRQTTHRQITSRKDRRFACFRNEDRRTVTGTNVPQYAAVGIKLSVEHGRVPIIPKRPRISRLRAVTNASGAGRPLVRQVTAHALPPADSPSSTPPTCPSRSHPRIVSQLRCC